MGGRQLDAARRLVRAVTAALVMAGALTASVIIPAVSANAATFNSWISRRTAIYQCTSMGFGYCASPFAAADVGPTHMVCWRDGPDNPNRWFYVFMPNGTEGYVYAPDVTNQVPTPSCASVNWIRASDFAYTHLGQVTDTNPADVSQFSASDWGPGPVGEWSGNCSKFTYLAWYTAGVTTGRAPTALDLWNLYKSIGAADTNLTHVPPRSALVFFSNPSVDGGAGHVGLSMGNWQFIGTRGLSNQGLPTDARDIRNVPGYLGWVFPATPDVPYNVRW